VHVLQDYYNGEKRHGEKRQNFEKIELHLPKILALIASDILIIV